MATTVSCGLRPLRVLVVTDQYAPMVGGVPTVTGELAARLGERGHAVTVLAPSRDRLGHRRAARDGGAAVHLRGSLPWPWYPDQRLGLLPPGQASALLAGFAPDVVHVVYTNHYLPQNVWPAAPARPGPREAAFYAYLTRFANRCDQVTAPSATALRLMREHGLRAPSQAVSNGIDRLRCAGSPGSTGPASGCPPGSGGCSGGPATHPGTCACSGARSRDRSTAAWPGPSRPAGRPSSSPSTRSPPIPRPAPATWPARCRRSSPSSPTWSPRTARGGTRRPTR